MHEEPGDAGAGSTGSNGQTRAMRLLQAALASRLLALNASIVVVLLATAQSYDGSIHRYSHWLVLGAYAVVSLGLGIAERLEANSRDRPGLGAQVGRTEWLAWASTILNAAVVVYIEVEHMLAGAASDFDEAAGAISRLPAFLLLLQTGLSMRVWHTVVFSSLVSAAWGATLLIAAWRPQDAALGPEVTLAEEFTGLMGFVVASVIVIDGVRRLRAAVKAALRLEHERTQLARFVPEDVAGELARDGMVGTVKERHACLLALDIRGFSAMTRERSRDEVVAVLLGVRALVHAAVTEHGGIVDKYVGDGILAQFLVGPPERQAECAIEAAHAIQARLVELNRKRARERRPPIAIAVALHAGEVLVGVFDDGLRAEYTVLGPAMNTLSRLEGRTKAADLALAASEDFVRLLADSTLNRLDLDRLRQADDAPGEVPALYALADAGGAPLTGPKALPVGA